MQIPKDPTQHPNTEQSSAIQTDALKSIAYSLDALVPGFYLWCGPIKLRIGGCVSEESYPGTIHSTAGMAIVLPNYRIYSTYQDSYNPQQAQTRGYSAD